MNHSFNGCVPDRSLSSNENPEPASRTSPPVRRDLPFIANGIPSWLSYLPGVLLLITVSYPLFFYRLADRDLWSSHEGRAGQDAQSVLDDGHWLVPQLFDKHQELQKPPLYYWLVAAIAKLRGRPVDCWDVRAPAAFAGLGGMLVLYALGCWRRRPLMGIVAALVLGTACHYTWQARLGRIDMPLALTISAALSLFYLGYRRSGRSGACYLAGYAALALALLLKGPIGLILSLPVVIVHVAVDRGLPSWRKARQWTSLCRELRLGWGLVTVAVIAGPWFIGAVRQSHGQFLETFLVHHNLERALGSGTLRSHPLWFYLPRFAVDFLPWTPALLVAGWWWWRYPEGSEDPEARFGLIWLVAMGVLLSCAGFKRSDYLVPAYGGAALLLGCAAERWYERAMMRTRLVGGFAGVVACCAVGWPIFCSCILPSAEPAREYERFAAEIRLRAPRPQLVLFFRCEAHALAFHLGAPLDTFLEWENLDIWSGRPGFYLVMPPECFAEAPQHLHAGCLKEVLRSTDFPGATQRERPLVLVRTCPLTRPSLARRENDDHRVQVGHSSP